MLLREFVDESRKQHVELIGEVRALRADLTAQREEEPVEVTEPAAAKDPDEEPVTEPAAPAADDDGAVEVIEPAKPQPPRKRASSGGKKG